MNPFFDKNPDLLVKNLKFLKEFQKQLPLNSKGVIDLKMDEF
jgi:hypothetical protein